MVACTQNMMHGVTHGDPNAHATALLLKEIELLRRERSELWGLVLQQEADLCKAQSELSPRTFAAPQEGVGGGRPRSVERQLENDRLLAAQEATAALHPLNEELRNGMTQLHHQKASQLRGDRLRGRAVQQGRPASAPRCVRQRPVGVPSSVAWEASGLPQGCGGSSSSSCTSSIAKQRWQQEAIASRPPERSTQTEFGRTTESWMEEDKQSRQVQTPRASTWQSPVTGHRPRSKPLSGTALGSDQALVTGEAPLPSQQNEGCARQDTEPVREALGRAVRSLCTARGALAEVTRRLGTEAELYGAEASRLRGLESAVASGLTGLSRELSAVRVASQRLRSTERTGSAPAVPTAVRKAARMNGPSSSCNCRCNCHGNGNLRRSAPRLS
eukprot:TRINITY_DN32086_c0_g1_i1.p1 TRINITY_DN32086_c0_g1~~TRINITY_DN32086_c0_g1_i1.p1  ORF type:complete len:424 (-),score=81.97 TRINITY_DN32086_c0_g1_i1:164-1324(-)